MIIEIDTAAGFCSGVRKAIDTVEKELQQKPLFALGEIVHNQEEVKRLEQKGLKTIQHADLEQTKGSCIFIRTHGEAPSTFASARLNAHTVIDATCPVVLKLQERLRKAAEKGQQDGTQLIIYGKKDHAEVIGLVGHSGNYARVVESVDDLAILDPARPVELFSQTTMHPLGLEKIASAIQSILAQKGAEITQAFTVHNTICRQVSGREDSIRNFAGNHEFILFVAGVNSSNGKMLFSWAVETNPRTVYISSPGEVQKDWFENITSVGITGATSTPQWLMEKVKKRVEEMVTK
jgi:4-hydroxy-3-methylbut-2-en-1-yl diphosphate reductase